MEVGKHTYGADGIVLIGKNTAILKIGSFCSIAGCCTVFLGCNHRTDWISTYPFGHVKGGNFHGKTEGHPDPGKNVIIGNDVWISRSVTIMSGVTIGDGAVIAACSVVTRDVLPYHIVGGNPARVISERFPTVNKRKLIEIAWWAWPDEKIEENRYLLCSGNIEEFIKKHAKKD